MKILNWRKALARALVTAGLVLPASAFAAELQVNLVNNPGFETVDANDPGPFTSVRALGWDDADGDLDDNFAYPYSSNYSGDPAPPGAGDYHFSGGFGTVRGEATITQSFDVSSGDSGALIATGNAQYDLRGFFSTYFTQADGSLAQARFLDNSQNELGRVNVGGLDFLNGLPAVGGRRFWGQDAARGTLPVGTATVAVDIVAATGTGNHDGYVDQIDFRIGGLPNDIALALQVDTNTGRARLNNLTSDPIDLKYYEIASSSGALAPGGWTSLQDQNLPGFPAGNGTGNGWEESGGSSASILAESYLLGSSNLTVSTTVGLGTPVADTSSGDLIFRYGLNNGLLLHGVVELVDGFGALPCDFNTDDACDIQDLDALVAAVVANSSDPTFDLNGDGNVTLADVTAETDGWLRQAGEENLGPGLSYLAADINLSGAVDVSDFNVWNSNKFQSTGLWSLGDLNADGVTDVADFNVWNGLKFESSSPASVPEPTGALVLFVSAAAIVVRQRTHTS